MEKNNRILYYVNSDWYFCLHWIDRAVAAKKAGYRIDVLAPITEESYKEEILSQGLKFHNIDMHRTSINPFNELRALFQTIMKVIELKPDLIHSVTIKPNIYAGLIARLKEIPIVSTFAGLGVLSTSNRLKYKLFFFFIKKLLSFISNSNKYTALFENQDDMDYLVSQGSIISTKVFRIYGAGVNTKTFSYHKENDSGKNILFAARMLKDKGLEDLISAIEVVKIHHPDVQLNVAGILDEVSPTGYSIQEILELEKKFKINWLGKCQDMPKLISRSNIVCLPTKYGEGVPRILIESAACGRAIISTNLGGCKDICVDRVTGLHVNQNDPEGIANVILELIENPKLRKELGENGRKLVKDRFSNNQIINQNINYYKNLLR